MTHACGDKCSLNVDRKMDRFFLLSLLGLLITGCAIESRSSLSERSRDPEYVMERTWQWQTTVSPVEKITVAQPERYTILLDGKGKVQVRFDCNRGGGEYQIAEGKLSFGPLLSTRMNCPPDTQDGLFMLDLQRVTSFYVENNILYLELPLDIGIMQSRRGTGRK